MARIFVGLLCIVLTGIGFALTPEFDGADANRQHISVELQKIVSGIEKPTDIIPVPDHDYWLVVLGQQGNAWLAHQNGSKKKWFYLDVATYSEQGLLGLAFHPKFPQDKRIFVHYSTSSLLDGGTNIVSFVVSGQFPDWKLTNKTEILSVDQPYPNHNGGQLKFGPDGYLYIGLGDGGYADDPQGHGQNTQTLLGSMLRIDIDQTDQQPYAIPTDNPKIANAAPEIWAYGFRNPWRFMFTDGGQLIVADVGQNTWEWIHLVEKGDNAGWNIVEGSHCFPPRSDCVKTGIITPIYEYSHAEGASIIGGYIDTSDIHSILQGKYLFGDFVSGRLWAIEIPETRQAVTEVFALGKWSINPSTFGQSHDGSVLVADYTSGTIYKIVEK